MSAAERDADKAELARRQHERAAVVVPLVLRRPERPPVFADAMNLSRGGLFIGMPSPDPVGTRLSVEILGGVAAELSLRTVVEVVRQQWTAPLGVGVRFIEISKATTAFIDRLVSDQRALSDYRLEQLLGRGGMGEVYRATGVRGPWAGTTVALKRVRPDMLTSPQAVALFQRECEIGRGLKHPNIVEVFDVRSSDEASFVTMELVDGYDLRRIIAACQKKDVHLPIDFACFVAHTVAEALDFAHHATAEDGTPLGLVHRDVAPSNVFVSRAGEIKLGDFGVAHVANSANTDEVAIAGKEPYIPADAFRGEPPTPTFDVFALAAVLYEMLTNQQAFSGANPSVIRKMIAAGAVEAPSHHRPDIPKALDALVMKGLAPYSEAVEPSWWSKVAGAKGGLRRFSSAAAFAEALRPQFDVKVGNDLAIAALIQHLFGSVDVDRPLGSF